MNDSIDNHHIIILGANGGIGRNLTDLLQSKPANLTLFSRSITDAAVPTSSAARIHVMRGDASHADDLRRAFVGQETAVACTNGDVYSQAKAIVEAAKDTPSLGRIIWVTGMGIHHEIPGSVGDMLDELARRMPEYVQAADTIAKSGKDYVLVRAAHLTDGEETNYSITHEGDSIDGQAVSRRTVARFIADIIDGDYPTGHAESLGITAARTAPPKIR